MAAIRQGLSTTTGTATCRIFGRNRLHRASLTASFSAKVTPGRRGPYNADPASRGIPAEPRPPRPSREAPHSESSSGQDEPGSHPRTYPTKYYPLAAFVEKPTSFKTGSKVKFEAILNSFYRTPTKASLLEASKANRLGSFNSVEGTQLLQYAQVVRRMDNNMMMRLVEACAEVGNLDCIIFSAARCLVTTWAPRHVPASVMLAAENGAKAVARSYSTEYIPLFQILLAGFRTRQKRFGEAETLIKSAMAEFTPNHPRCLVFLKISVWTMLGSVLRCLGPARANEATAAFHRAVIEDGDPIAMYALSRMIADFEVDQADGETAPTYPVRSCNRAWFDYTIHAATAGEVKSAFALGVFYIEATPEMFAHLDKSPADGASMQSILTEPSRFATLLERIYAGGGGPGFESQSRALVGEKWLLEAAQAGYVPAALYLARRLQSGTTAAKPDMVADHLRDALLAVRKEEKSFYQKDFDDAVSLVYPAAPA